MSLKIGIYRRVSTEEQAEAFEGSLDNQKYRLQSYVDMRVMTEKGWGRIVEDYVDDGYSAKDTNRPAYRRMIADVKRKKIDLILVADLSRLSRNLFDFCELLKFLDEQRASFLSIKEQFDTSTPVGRMIIYIIITLAQFEREQTAERVALGVHARGMRGLMNGGRPILGFDKDPQRPGVYVVNEREAQQVRQIFKTYLECGSKARTIARLSELEIHPKYNPHFKRQKQNRTWSVGLLGYLLSSAAYVGYHEVNKKNRDADQGKLKASQRYQRVRASWPAIVSEEIFNSTRLLLDEAKEIERGRLKGAEQRMYPFTGVLGCAECGLPLVGQSSHGKGGLYRYYGHTTAGARKGCSVQRVPADYIEGIVLGYLRDSLRKAGYFDRLTRRLGEYAEVSTSSNTAELGRMQNELGALNQEATNIFRMQGQGVVDPDALRLMSDRLAEIARRKDVLAKEVSVLEARLRESGDVGAIGVYIQERIEDFERGFRKSPPAVQKRLIRRTIKHIAVDSDKLAIWFFMSDADDIPGRKLKLVRDERANGGLALVSGDFVAVPKLSVASSDIGRIGDPGAI